MRVLEATRSSSLAIRRWLIVWGSGAEHFVGQLFFGADVRFEESAALVRVQLRLVRVQRLRMVGHAASATFDGHMHVEHMRMACKFFFESAGSVLMALICLVYPYLRTCSAFKCVVSGQASPFVRITILLILYYSLRICFVSCFGGAV